MFFYSKKYFFVHFCKFFFSNDDFKICCWLSFFCVFFLFFNMHFCFFPVFFWFVSFFSFFLACFSPPARWRLLDFIRAVLLLLLRLRILLRHLLLAVQISVGTAGPPLRAPDPSGHCRTSTASCRSQWALPDLNRDFQIAVGTAGPQREECQKRCQIECQKICQIECQKACQKECQKTCQTECQKICQKECQKICQIECQKICQIKCHEICQIECQKICLIECQKIEIYIYTR